MLSIRTSLTPADIPAIVRYHDEYYAEHYGFNHDFGLYVQGPLTEFFERNDPDERIWLLENETGIQGCVALVRNSSEESQLRWFYVDESLRGRGYGQQLMQLLLDFARDKGYKRIILWTVSQLTDARRLYERNGFKLKEEHESNVWGLVLVEQMFGKTL
jgi:GNAT superfamily N-acetyltransferase